MLERLRNLWVATDLRKKILFTLVMLLVFRVLASIPVPLTPEQQQQLAQIFAGNGDKELGQLLGLLDTFSGGSLQQFSIVALGVYPYITATIVMQLLTPIIPKLEAMQQDGGAERQKLNDITRLVAVPLAFFQAVGQCAIFVRKGVLDASTFNLLGPDWLNTLAILISLTAGTMILVWIGEQITEHGIGNGISILIFGGIVSGLPEGIRTDFLVGTSGAGSNGGVSIAIFLLLDLLIILGCVYLYLGQLRIPVRYPTKRQVGQRLLVGSSQASYIPMQVNSAGMVPLIFAQSMLIFPATLAQYLIGNRVAWLSSAAQWVVTYLANPTQWYYWFAFALLVVAFTYFYTYVVWQQQNVAGTLQKQGAVIPSYRPGAPTSRYLLTRLNRITLIGAFVLGLIAFLPFFTQVNGSQLLDSAKLLIVVGVVLDTLRQLEAHMTLRNYKGLLGAGGR